MQKAKLLRHPTHLVKRCAHVPQARRTYSALHSDSWGVQQRGIKLCWLVQHMEQKLNFPALGTALKLPLHWAPGLCPAQLGRRKQESGGG